MTKTYVALLRGVNVGGRSMVAMSDLRQLLTGMGFEDVRTLLQSGNVVFKGDSAATGHLEKALEAAALESLGLKSTFFIRTPGEMDAIIAANKFPAEAVRDPSHVIVTFLRAAPDPNTVAALRAAALGGEMVAAEGRQLYVYYADGVARSRLSAAVLGPRLGLHGTGRNWNTVLKLAAMCR